MAEPTSSAIVGGVTSGAVGAVLIALGISWPLVIWGVCGAIFGLSRAPETGRARAIILFLCTALMSAKFGMVIALYAFSGSVDVAGGLSVLMGVVMHPMLAAVVEFIPSFLDRFVKGAEK